MTTLLKTDEAVAEMVREKQPEWEYVDGYTGCDGRLNLRHKACGYIYNMSSVSVRKGKHLRCEHCEQEKQKQLKAERKERKRIEKIVTRFNQPAPKGEQLQAKTCPDCGAFYFPAISTSKCCPDCQKKRINRYYSRKKDLKKHRSQTGDSNQISARKLYAKENGVCWICGGQCDINADPNSNYYPSVDHIIPRSKGGLDKWDNVHLAHRICNTKRSNGDFLG